MKPIATIFFSLLSFSYFAQKANLLFEVDHDYIFADTNGKIAFDKRFDKIFEVDGKAGVYIVRSDYYKYGVVKNNAYLFPCEYTQISDIHPAFRFYVYDLERDNGHALAASDGTLLTGFSYRQIDQYRLDRSSEDLGVDDEGAFFRMYIGPKHHLMYVSKDNKSKLLTKEPADEISDYNGLFLLKKGKLQALYEFDQESGSLKMIHPYADQSLGFNRNEYYQLDRVKQVTKVYSYDHKVLETIKGMALFQDDKEVLEIVGPEEAVPLGEPRIVSLDRERELLQDGIDRKVFSAFKLSEQSNSVYKGISYPARFDIRGKKKDWKVTSYYSGTGKAMKRDTSFYVAVDELIPDTYSSGVIITHKGKLFGAIDSRGNEIFPPKFKSLQHISSEDRFDWLVEREKSRSTLYGYDPLSKKVYPILNGRENEQYEIHQNLIRTSFPTEGIKHQERVVNWVPGNWSSDPIVTNSEELYDMTLPNKLFPYFVQTMRGTKHGVLSRNSEVVIPCIYDSVKVNAYFLPVVSEYQDKPEYKIVQPIFSAYLNGKQHIFHPTENEFSTQIVHSFEAGSLNASARISEDGLYVIDTVGNNRVEIYSINGKKMTREPIVLSYYNRKMATFTNGYWYIRGTDSQGQDVILGQNGAWFVLPPKLMQE